MTSWIEIKAYLGQEDPKLRMKLEERYKLVEGLEEREPTPPPLNPLYVEFSDFSVEEIMHFEETFEAYDTAHTGFLDLFLLKHMMEKLGEPQTHLGLKAMIKEVDEDQDNKISFREFLLIFRKARAGELVCDGLNKIVEMAEVDVGEVGVKGAKDFFTAKADAIAQANKFENEIKEEQERKRKEAEEAADRRRKFRAKVGSFDRGQPPVDGQTLLD